MLLVHSVHVNASKNAHIFNGEVHLALQLALVNFMADFSVTVIQHM